MLLKIHRFPALSAGSLDRNGQTFLCSFPRREALLFPGSLDRWKFFHGASKILIAKGTAQGRNQVAGRRCSSTSSTASLSSTTLRDSGRRFLSSLLLAADKPDLQLGKIRASHAELLRHRDIENVRGLIIEKVRRVSIHGNGSTAAASDFAPPDCPVSNPDPRRYGPRR